MLFAVCAKYIACWPAGISSGRKNRILSPALPNNFFVSFARCGGVKVGKVTAVCGALAPNRQRLEVVAGKCFELWSRNKTDIEKILGTIAWLSHGLPARNATRSIVLSGPSLSLECPSRRQHTIGLAEILRSAAFPGSAGSGRPGQLPRVASMRPAGPPSSARRAAYDASRATTPAAMIVVRTVNAVTFTSHCQAFGPIGGVNGRYPLSS
jgi:hypothetical protein